MSLVVRSPRRRPVLVTSLLLAGCLGASSALAGCSALSDDTGSGSGSDSGVVAAFYPLEYAAERVAGDLIDVNGLAQPGVEPHDLELTINETAMIADASVVVFEADFMPAVDEAVDQNADGEVLDVTEAADLIPVDDEVEGHEDEEGGHAEEEEGHAEDEEGGHAEEEEGHAEDEEDGHDHGDLDPHFWLDPLRMADVADAIADTLAEADSDNADEYAANAADLRADLERLDEAYTSGLADCERDTIVVSHDAFGYLGRYGLEIAPVAGLSPDAEPTPAARAELERLIERDGITTVFSERLAPPRLTETLAEDAGVTTQVLDPIEGLTDETADEDYLSLMEQNLEALERANGCR